MNAADGHLHIGVPTSLAAALLSGGFFVGKILGAGYPSRKREHPLERL